MKSLSELPNQDGFRFIGVDGEHNKYECVVLRTVSGVPRIYRVVAGTSFEYYCPTFCKQLIGWIK